MSSALMPSSPAAVASATPTRLAVLDHDTATLDDLLEIDRHWTRLRHGALMATTQLMLPIMRLDNLAGDLLLVLSMLLLLTTFKPSLWMRLVARLHGCSPALTTSLVQACDHELSVPIRSWKDWKRGLHGTERVAFKQVQFRCILEGRQ